LCEDTLVCDFSPVAFSVFGFAIHWYSLAYIFGVAAALRLSIFLSQQLKYNIPKSLLDDFIGAAILGIVLGGRLGHVLFYDFDYYLKFPLETFKIWRGGMSFYGGFIGVVLAAYLFCRKHHIFFLNFIDLWSVGVPIGLFLGRIANFINAELLGKKSFGPCSVIFSDGVPRYPSQLYEAFLEGILLFCTMLIAFQKKCHRYGGRLSGIFCSGYGIARFSAEFFRESDSAFSEELLQATGLNLNQFMSIALMVLGVFLILNSKKLDA
jgi:phosphatidylglycerol:prolipoprotein diacylglycerol transferase